MAKSGNKTTLLLSVGVSLCLTSVLISVGGIGWPPVAHPRPVNNSIGIFKCTAHANDTWHIIPVPRINTEFGLALYKDGKKILALDKNNKTTYLNYTGTHSEQIMEHFRMKIINDTHSEAIIQCGSGVEGGYSFEYYKNNASPPGHPPPVTFSIIRLAEKNVSDVRSAKGTQPTPKTVNFSSTKQNMTETMSTEGMQPTTNTDQARFTKSPLTMVFTVMFVVEFLFFMFIVLVHWAVGHRLSAQERVGTNTKLTSR